MENKWKTLWLIIKIFLFGDYFGMCRMGEGEEGHSLRYNGSWYCISLNKAIDIDKCE